MLAALAEGVPSLAESGGVDQKSYEVARSSARMETRRRVSVVVTNPGSPEHWCYQRFISPGRPGAVRCRVPASDRLTAEDVTRLRDSFATPDLRLRLAEGEWTEIKLGPEVATGYNPTTHIAPRRLDVGRSDLLLGWDSAPNAHTHAVVIGARLDANVYVRLNLCRDDRLAACSRIVPAGRRPGPRGARRWLEPRAGAAVNDNNRKRAQMPGVDASAYAGASVSSSRVWEGSQQ